MALSKYLKRNQTSGLVEEGAPVVASAGAGDDGKLVALDPTGRLDGSVLPVGIVADTYTNVATGALSAGDLAYVKSDGTIARASGASGGNPAVGFVLAASLAGAAATIYFEGRDTALAGLTVGSRYYLSDATPGAVTLTPVTGAGKLHQYVGTAVSTTSLSTEFDDAILLLA